MGGSLVEGLRVLREGGEGPPDEGGLPEPGVGARVEGRVGLAQPGGYMAGRAADDGVQEAVAVAGVWTALPVGAT